MRLVIKALKYGVLFSTIASTLFSIAILSVVPILLLRHFLLPEYLLSIPVDFVAKTVRSSTFAPGEPHLVASVDLSTVPDFSGQDYSIDLQLRLPRSQGNLDMGNFVVRGALSSQSWNKAKVPDNLDLNSVERMGLLPYKSPTIEKISRFVYSPLYVLGLVPEESDVEIPLWRTTSRPKTHSPYLLLTLPPDILVSKADLVFEVQLHGLRWLLKTFPIFSTLIGSTAVFLASVVGLGSVALFVYLNLPKPTLRQTGPFSDLSKEKRAASPSANDHHEDASVTLNDGLLTPLHD